MRQLTVSSTVRIADDVVFRELEGEAVVLNLATGTYFGLDAVGTRIWQLLDRLGRLEAVRNAMMSEYDVDARDAEKDLLDLVSSLASHGLVTIDP